MRAPELPGRRRRLARLRASRTHTGTLGIGGMAALAEVGFEQVSEVMGAGAFVVPPRSFFAYGTGTLFTSTYPPGWTGTEDGAEPIVLTSSTQRDGRVPAEVTAIKSGYRLALQRLTDEVRALGADGVIGVRVARDNVDHPLNAREVCTFVATGTAVRSRGRARAEVPFTSALDAAQTAAALRAGWLPTRFLACPVMAVRWIAQDERQPTKYLTRNIEFRSYTKVVNACRHQARTDFARAAARTGGAGAIMSDMSLEIRPDLDVAQVSAMVLITGTALLPFGHESAPSAKVALSLGGSR